MEWSSAMTGALWLGIFIGAVVIGGVVGIIWLLRRSGKNSEPQRSNGSSRAPNSRSGSAGNTSSSKDSAEETTRRERIALYEELRGEWYSINSTNDTSSAYEAYLVKLDTNKSKLDAESYQVLKGWTESRLAGIADKEARAAEVAPKLRAFMALRSETDKNVLFDELHKIVLLDDDTGIISSEDLEEFGTEDDVNWAATTYDTVLEWRLRELLILARDGDVSDYRKVMDLWQQLDDNDYYDETNEEDREYLVRTKLAREWNEMIVRFKRKLDWEDDLFTLDELDSDDYPDLLQKAKSGDLFALRVILLLIEDEDEDLSELIIELTNKALQADADAQSEALGFAPGATTRSI